MEIRKVAQTAARGINAILRCSVFVVFSSNLRDLIHKIILSSSLIYNLVSSILFDNIL